MATLERRDAAHAQYETREAEEGLRLLLVACEAMEYAARQVLFVFSQDRDHLLLRLPAVDHQWEARLHAPPHLLLKRLQLFLLVLPRPIEVESTLADTDHLRRQIVSHPAQRLLPTGVHLLGLQPYQRVAVARILTAERQHGRHVVQVDGRHDDLPHPSLAGPVNDGGEVFAKLLAVQMGMCVNKRHLYLRIIRSA